MRDRYAIVVGLLFAILIAVAYLNRPGGDDGTLGLDRQRELWPLPEFAVPLASTSLEGDANVAQDDCEGAALPCPPDARRTPACRVREPDSIRVCDLFDRPAVISFWFSRGGDTCIDQQDVLDRVYARYRDRVSFLSLNVRDERASVRELISRRGWRMPVGYDRDGAVASLYKVGLCPTFAYVYPGGVLQSASLGELDRAGLSTRIERLLEATRRRERA